MKNLFYKLLAPWRYYTIRESSKTLFWLNWGLPALVTIATSAVYFFYPEVIREHIFQSKDVLGFLSGFFITALSAVAVFDRKGMDEAMPGNVTAVFRSDIDTKAQRYSISRRRFLCMQFSFLAAQSFILAFLASLCPKFNKIFIIISSIVYLFFFFQITLIALHGLYYLGEKLLNAPKAK